MKTACIDGAVEAGNRGVATPGLVIRAPLKANACRADTGGYLRSSAQAGAALRHNARRTVHPCMRARRPPGSARFVWRSTEKKGFAANRRR